MNRKDLEKVIKFLHQSEKLKDTMRHSWTSKGRQESVAEHSWRLSLMALLLIGEFEEEVDLSKLLSIIIIHDLAEVVTGDIPVFEKSSADRIEEHEAFRSLMKTISGGQGSRFYDLWIEYENGTSVEGRIAKALDKIEAQLQHNEAGIGTWTEWEKCHTLSDFSETRESGETLKELMDLVLGEAHELIENSGDSVSDLKDRCQVSCSKNESKM
jgi:putative hydrolase of HD superfamily